MLPLSTSRDSGEHLDFEGEEVEERTLGIVAEEELDKIILALNASIENFFSPFYLKEITQNLHYDFLRLTQDLLMKKYESGEVYKVMCILMRVDSQINDKDLR